MMDMGQQPGSEVVAGLVVTSGSNNLRPLAVPLNSGIYASNAALVGTPEQALYAGKNYTFYVQVGAMQLCWC